jgi:hypothetical protein
MPQEYGKIVHRASSNVFDLKRMGAADYRLWMSKCSNYCWGPTPYYMLLRIEALDLCTSCMSSVYGGYERWVLSPGSTLINRTIPCCIDNRLQGQAGPCEGAYGRSEWATYRVGTYPGPPLAYMLRYWWPPENGGCDGPLPEPVEYGVHAWFLYTGTIGPGYPNMMHCYVGVKNEFNNTILFLFACEAENPSVYYQCNARRDLVQGNIGPAWECGEGFGGVLIGAVGGTVSVRPW